MTATRTSTKSFQRISLVCLQVRRLLRRTTGINEPMLDGLVDGVKQRWFNRVTVVGLDSSRLCWAKIDLEIDWDEHDRQCAFGRATVAVDPTKWRDDTAIEVDECINSFTDAVNQDNLKAEWQVWYSASLVADPVALAQVEKQLGLSRTEQVKLAPALAGLPFSIKELSELRVGGYFADK